MSKIQKAKELLESEGYQITKPEIRKTLIIDGIEYETKTHSFNRKLKDIKIPRGWRLWTAEECIKLFNSHEKELNLFDCWFFIKQPFKKFKNKYISWLYAGSYGADLGANGNPQFANPGLGVRFCREIEK